MPCGWLPSSRRSARADTTSTSGAACCVDAESSVPAVGREWHETSTLGDISVLSQAGRTARQHAAQTAQAELMTRGDGQVEQARAQHDPDAQSASRAADRR
jgi:hypothetical protein